MKDSQSCVDLHHTLSTIFGFDEFRDGQLSVIENIVAGKDALVLLPTGGGKSLCYQLPAIAMPGTAVVVSPLISLMQDQVEQVNELGVKAAFINSSQAQEQQQHTYDLLNNGQLDLLYVSPEKLLQHSFLKLLSNLTVSLFAIDEAHCVSHWGHDFRADYRQLYQLKQRFPDVPVVGLTATADRTTQADIVAQLGLNDPFVHKGSFDRPNIRYRVVQKYKAFEQVAQYIDEQDGSGIIYCNSRAKVDDLTQKLQKRGLRCASYHAGMESEERAWVQRQFLTDSIQVVIATVAFGMGINKSNVRFVVHHDVPRSIESYYQETGRAGRDGLPSEALLLFDEKDAARVRQWIEQGENEERLALCLQKFAAMESFGDALTCRRQVLLNYFSELTHTHCGNCDICLDPPKMIDGLVLAQKVLSCILRLQQSATAQYVIDILRGRQHKKLDPAHFELSTYGIGKAHSDAYWHSIINQLIHKGLLRVDIEAHAVLRITEGARPVLKGETQLQIATPRLDVKSNKKSESKVYDKELFARLKHLRKVIADENGVPPFVVFSDATLIDITEKLPQTDGQFLQVSGVGNTKLERYGDAFLTLLKDYSNRDHMGVA
ncbi:DNA helicase RecQ [Alteromonas sediminis]|uniref:DNA helicase RecQ n=1 Tax=Alteromonas sediminis TaxID=2259342 RepID=A0A3N5YKD7_9ALTE|nr:DNA helicase RecQ [Alteromonas sediminis]RPJ65361.1 DNA helicase RecQ [Alteromonas sediminis]